MTWNDLNIYQWQRIQLAIANRTIDDTELDLAVKFLSIVTDKSELEIDSYSIVKLTEEIKQIAFINELPKPNASDYIEVNGRKYKCIYDIKRMPFARYFETKYFSQDVGKNMHNIMACMVMPMKKNWFGKWVVDKYDSSKHADYAQDMLEAKFINAYGSMVFFYHVFKNSIENLKGYLVAEIMKSKKMTTWQAEELVQTLCDNLDGFIKANSLQTLNQFKLTKSTN